jgi:hypothetical protein
MRVGQSLAQRIEDAMQFVITKTALALTPIWYWLIGIQIDDASWNLSEFVVFLCVFGLPAFTLIAILTRYPQISSAVWVSRIIVGLSIYAILTALQDVSLTIVLMMIPVSYWVGLIYCVVAVLLLNTKK